MSDKQRIILVLQSAVKNVITDQCCSTCSTSGIPDGSYAYFHAQDIERAFSRDGKTPVADEANPRYDWEVDDGGLTADEYAKAVDEASILIAPLYIGYGTDDGTDKTVTPVRRTIVTMLQLAKFLVEDPGDNRSRIVIRGVDGVPFPTK